MPHVLVVKTSSMGDVIHTLPAITDARSMMPEITFDWVVEEAFQDIPASHPAVNEVIPVAMRRWRRNITLALLGDEFRQFRATLKRCPYDLVIDAQGLMKSGLITRWAGSRSAGLDWRSAREPLCSLFYHRKVEVPRNRHAVERTRSLFAGALEYRVPGGVGRFGLRADTIALDEGLQEYCHERQILFIHSTTWQSKLWPVEYWKQLAEQVVDSGYHVLLPWGDESEKQQAEAIADGKSGISVLPRLKLQELMGILAATHGVVSGDTGLGHLAIACGVPTVAVYGPTDPGLTGIYGADHRNLVSDHLPCIPCKKRKCKFAGTSTSGSIYPPCFTPLTPALVWSELSEIIRTGSEPDLTGRESER
jgi:heptosyltransferase-1